MSKKKIKPELMEKLAEAVHRAYCKSYALRTGKEYWTKGDYSCLDEATKQIDRETVKAVIEILETRALEAELARALEKVNDRLEYAMSQDDSVELQDMIEQALKKYRGQKE